MGTLGGIRGEIMSEPSKRRSEFSAPAVLEAAQLKFLYDVRPLSDTEACARAHFRPLKGTGTKGCDWDILRRFTSPERRQSAPWNTGCPPLLTSSVSFHTGAPASMIC